VVNWSSLRLKWLFGVVAGCLVGCGDRVDPLPPAEGTPVVGVIELRRQSVELSTSLPGRTVPYLIAEVRPQVDGLIVSRQFIEGSKVELGQTLYQIDPASYRARYDSARASLARSEAILHSVRLKAERFKQLSKFKAVSTQEHDDVIAALGQAEADVSAGQASVQSARINLQYARVKAPIAGIIGRSSVTPGALVTAHQGKAMATIQQLDPIYVDLTQSSIDMLRLRKALAQGDLTTVDAGLVKVTLLLEDGSAYPLSGKLAFSETTVNQSTGAITLRALFPNPTAELLPGMYVQAVLQEGVKSDALLVPKVAVTRNHAGKPIAFVVGADHKLQQRLLETERAIGNYWLVSSGVRPGEQLVVEGMMRARDGIEVEIVPLAQIPTDAEASLPGQS
jgi:membrane fusion protein (multidrug efflux system)